MSEPQIEIKNDKVYVYTPLPEYGKDICRIDLVMTKDIFRECFRQWIADDEKSEKGENQ